VAGKVIESTSGTGPAEISNSANSPGAIWLPGWAVQVTEVTVDVDDYFQVAEYEEFCATSLPAAHELVVEYFASPEFDTLLVEEVRRVFPAHEHEEMVARHRGLVGAWVADQG